MCGIAGVLRTGDAPVDPVSIKAMCDVQAHRGPDDAGYACLVAARSPRDGGYWTEFTDDAFRHDNEHLASFSSEYARRELALQPFDLVLGHRRLAILDLSSLGHQPMASVDRRLWVVFNGEIYNFRELRSELEAKGRIFRTRTDTEVLLQLWAEEGPDCVSRLNGMFAFALYDSAEGRLFLVRDRFGVKPLYYACTSDALVFASEPKGILASGLLEPRIDPGSLAEYMTFQNQFGDRSIFEGIRLLPPGRILEARVGRRVSESHSRAYHPGFFSTDGFDESFDSASARVFEAFAIAVERQLVSDVPVGSYLSGGMDSGSIVALASRSIPRLTTFTGGFDLTNVSGIEQGFDERPLAERLSYLSQTEHYAVVLHAGDMPAAMKDITWHVDDPRLGMCHQNWYVAKLASRFVKVCLAGAGGDELFAGYPWRYQQVLSSENTTAFDDRYYAYWHRLLPSDRLRRLLQPEMRPYLDKTRESFQRAVGGEITSKSVQDKPLQMLDRALRFEFSTFLHGFLAIEDRLSMAHGLETRVPFLDNDLADLAWSLPAHYKLDLTDFGSAQSGAYLEGGDGKLVLRRAMQRVLPKAFTSRKKQGFSPPDANWYRGPSMNYVREILLDRRTRERPWFDQKFLGSVLEEHFSGDQNHRLLIWSLLSLEWLQRHFVDP